MVTFDAVRARTGAAEWAADPRWGDVPPFDVGAVSELIVFSAHPDDETIGVGGLLAHAAEHGVPVRIIVATASGDDRRPDELADALSRLGLASHVEAWDLPDGALKHHATALRDRIDRALADADDRVLVLAPWPADRHGDHRTLGREVGSSAALAAREVLFYPIWLWQWGEPDDAPWSRMLAVPLTDEARRRKNDALDAFPSQLRSAANPDGVLSEEFVDIVRTGPEVLIRPERNPTALERDAHFERLHAGSDDPWAVRSRWYERRKRSLLLASLPAERYGRVLELGCSIGETTLLLAERSDTVVAVDGSAAAVATARGRLAAQPGVSVERMHVPSAWPAGAFDLIVISEVAYYLADDEWLATIERCRESLAPGGVVVLCHWLGAADDFAQSGEQAHAVFRATAGHAGLASVVEHRDAAFLLEAFQADGGTPR